MRHKIRVGVLRGGPSAEYEVSLKTGAAMLNALRENLDEKYDVRDILIDRSGTWHVDGRPIDAHDSPKYFDVALNALHGTYGEDGKVQHMFEQIHMPFTGSGSMASAIGMNKILTKKILKQNGIKSPYWKEISSAAVNENPFEQAHLLFGTFLMPAVIKPNASGSSVGVSIVRNRNEIMEALKLAAQHGDTILVEELIPGTEVTCGVVENFRNESLYALPPVEIRPAGSFFDYSSKYDGKSVEIVPARLPHDIRKEIEELARNVHRLLQLRHYSRTDMIVHPRRGIYVLETNTLPGMTEESLIPKALHAVGSKFHDFIDHLVGLALGRSHK